jgi:phage shock protein A
MDEAAMDDQSKKPGATPPALDDDEDVVDAEIVETTTFTAPSVVSAASIAPDYSEAGVPSLDYVRNKIEGRYGTALGSTELAEAAAAREAASRAEAQHREAVTAEQQSAAREQAAKDKLDEIRRSIKRGG